MAKLLTIYIEEAHARDEWWLPLSPEAHTKRSVLAHKTISDRIAAAKRFINDLKFDMDIVCDSMMFDNAVRRYGAWPERLYIILDGVVVYKGGEGPFGYKLYEVKQWLADHYGLRGEIIRKSVATSSSSCCSIKK